jgi:hypothetical protein
LLDLILITKHRSFYKNNVCKSELNFFLDQLQES